MTCNLYLGFSQVLTKSFTSEFPHVERYFWTMVNQPNFKKVLGEVTQTESVPPVQSVKNPSQPKDSGKSKPKPKDEVKKEAKREVQKEAVKPKAEEAGGEEEDAPKPRPKNSLDLLPPSKMILDEWKRLYSNTKSNFREVAIKGICLRFLRNLWMFPSSYLKCISFLWFDGCGISMIAQFKSKLILEGPTLVAFKWVRFDQIRSEFDPFGRFGKAYEI